MSSETVFTAHRIDDERGYYFWEIHARTGDRIEVVAVCDDEHEARQVLRAIKAHAKGVRS
jgi:hypothetical protein